MSVFVRTCRSFLAGAVLFLAASAFAQEACSAPAQPSVSSEQWKTYSRVFTEFGRVYGKSEDAIPSPQKRTRSSLLPLLPESTIFYAAFPNYGVVSHQFMAIFRHELEWNGQLRSWWLGREMQTERPKIEYAMDSFYRVSQFLGDEVVVSAVSRGKCTPAFLALAEVQKPGLKEFLEQTVQGSAGNLKPAARIFDPAALASAQERTGAYEPAILVLPDLVVAAGDVTTLRNFYQHLQDKKQGFLSTELGMRVARSYEDGVTSVAAVDLRALLTPNAQDAERSAAPSEMGSPSELKYLVWERAEFSGTPISQFELSFTKPRRGVASWIAAPGRMHGFSFVSPKALAAGSILLKQPAAIFDDIRSLAAENNPKAMAALVRLGSAIGINFRQDLLSRLGNELTVELDSFGSPTTGWKVILQVKDPSAVQATLRSLFVASHMEFSEMTLDGVTYHTIRVSCDGKPQGIVYAFVDGYLIIGPGRQPVTEAIHIYRSGHSLASSQKFQEALSPGDLSQASAIVYEDPLTVAALGVKNTSPELAAALSKPGPGLDPVIMCIYGDEAALREVSRSRRVEFGATVLLATIANPNLLRGSAVPNESSAVAMVRKANSAEITYASSYPEKGYARSLAALGADLNETPRPSPPLGWLESVLDSATDCKTGAWCAESGYRFTIQTPCQASQKCREYVVVATPENASIGTRNFCSTSDGVVRVRPGAPLRSAITPRECRGWAPLQTHD